MTVGVLSCHTSSALGARRVSFYLTIAPISYPGDTAATNFLVLPGTMKAVELKRHCVVGFGDIQTPSDGRTNYSWYAWLRTNVSNLESLCALRNIH